jgi:alpha-amylase/alpha-mannosidase (GH57 family)
MIYWAQLFHFYQPPTQMPVVLEKICNESYKPLLKVLHQNPHVRATLNVNGVLLEMLNDYRAITKSGADAETKTSYYHKVVAARDVRNKIVDRLFIL